MSKVELLPSGNYRVRKMVEGKNISLTFKTYPKESEIIKALSIKLTEAPKKEIKVKSFTFSDAVKKYAELKEESVSEKYVAELLTLPNKLSPTFVNCDLSEITQLMLDEEILKWQKKGLSPKTVKNHASQIRTVIRKFRPDAFFNTDMCKPIPIVQDEDIYIPSPEEVDLLLDYFAEHFPDQYCAFALSAFGLRREEICALTLDDLDEDDQVHINKAKVKDSIGAWVIRPYPKNIYSVRAVPIDPNLAEDIKAQGFIFPYSPNRLGKSLTKAQSVLGIEHFSLHKMRHYFASRLHAKGVPDADIKRLLGHQKGSNCLDIVYKHSQIDRNKERKREIVDSVIGLHFKDKKRTVKRDSVSS